MARGWWRHDGGRCTALRLPRGGGTKPLCRQGPHQGGPGPVLAPTLISLGRLACWVVPLGWLLGRQFGLVATWVTYLATYWVALVPEALYFPGV